MHTEVIPLVNIMSNTRTHLGIVGAERLLSICLPHAHTHHSEAKTASHAHMTSPRPHRLRKKGTRQSKPLHSRLVIPDELRAHDAWIITVDGEGEIFLQIPYRAQWERHDGSQ